MIIKEIQTQSVLIKSNLPVIVNFLYHEEIKKSAKKGGKINA